MGGKDIRWDMQQMHPSNGHQATVLGWEGRASAELRAILVWRGLLQVHYQGLLCHKKWCDYDASKHRMS